MPERNEAPLTIRERLVLRLVLLLIKLLAPWRHDHEFRDVLKQIEAEVAK